MIFRAHSLPLWADARQEEKGRRGGAGVIFLRGGKGIGAWKEGRAGADTGIYFKKGTFQF